MAQNKFPGFGKWDRENSTYRHEIYLKGRNFLVGYSKGWNVPEPPDNIQTLQGVISRLHVKYLNPIRTESIHFYHNNSRDILFILYPDWYSILHPDYNLHPKFEPFLKRLYTMRRDGKIVTEQLKDRFYGTRENELFSVHKERFKNLDTLTDFCIKMQGKGHNRDQVVSFYNAYRQKWLLPPSERALYLYNKHFGATVI
jgi:hypothetical protein